MLWMHDIPVIYTAVSDPAGAGLVNEDGTNVGNITGTSDKLPVTEQMALIRELMPDAKKIGILYTTSEANSVSTIQEYKDHAEEYGFEIVDTGINTIADVEMAAKDLASKGRLHLQPDRQYRCFRSSDRSGSSKRRKDSGLRF